MGDTLNMEAEYLRFLTYKGCRERYGVDVENVIVDNLQDHELLKRIAHELDTIEKAGFPGYFLIVADILRFCREAGIPTGPGRGSICGSAVAFATYITDVEPISFGIPFERFLHLERIAQPDIDLDICQARRQEVIEYLRRTYGEDSVAQIITFTPLNAKSVVKDVCRVLHVDDILRDVKSNETGEKLSSLIPDGQGADQVKLQEFLEEPEGAEFKATIEKLHVPFEGEKISVLETCLTLEGLRRHGSVHAAGVVIADRPLIELAPLYRKNQSADVQIQYDMRDAETAGLLKMDVLGLRTVTVLGEAEQLVRKTDPAFRIKNVPLVDKATFELLSSGDTGAVFQLEGDGITAACVGMRPDRFEDIVALIALYRPGPMEQLGSYFRRKHGEEAVEYSHPLLRPILERTYGLMVYQEQVMGIVRALGGYTAGEADQFRKAIGKKLVPLIREKIDEFANRAVARGHDEALIKSIGDQIFDFGRYGFNLGHATGYGFITYWTAYLKANYPAEFFTANLNSQIGKLDNISRLLRDAEKHGIQILPPDINISGIGFTLDPRSGEQSTIRFGLGAIKGVGGSFVTDIIEERDATVKNKYSSKRIDKVKPDGTPYKANVRVTERTPNIPSPFEGVYDFCRRLPHVPINAKVALARAGAFGADMEYRRKLLSCLGGLNEAARSGRSYDVVADESNLLSPVEIMHGEKEVLGFYISSHPLGFYKQDIARYGATIDGDFEHLDYKLTIAGMVMGIRTHQAKNGPMAWVTLESGISGLPDITVFNSVWAEVRDQVVKDKIIIVKGNKKHDARFGWAIIANEITVIDRARPDAEVISISLPQTDIMDLWNLSTMGTNEGANVQVVVESGSEGRIALIATRLMLPPTGATIAALEEQGWMVNIDPIDPSMLSWEGKRLRTKASQFSGSGPYRKHISEIPIVQTALRALGGRVVTELEVT
jgi:DNA polymerase-3 subunit alpha